VQILIDGTDSTSATTGMGYASGMIQQFSSKIMVESIQKYGIRTTDAMIPIDNRLLYWYNPELKSTNFIIPGLIAVILMMLSALLTSMTVVREMERGTIESLIVSPVKPVELIVGKLIPYVFIAFCDVIIVIFASKFVFEVPLRGSPVLVMVLSCFFLISALGIGLLISTLAPTQQIAMTAAVIGSQLPTILLSGFIFPISNMPQALQTITSFIPATHFVKILRNIFLKGSGVSALVFPITALLLLSTAIISACILNFKKRL